MVAWVLANAAGASPGAVMGVELRPLSRADLTWVVEGNTTGVVVGSLDGLAKPNLQAYGGLAVGPRLVVLGSLGVARAQTTTEADDVVTVRHFGVVRPAVDLRVGLAEANRRDLPLPFAFAGVHLSIPSAGESSTAFTDEEQELSNRSAAEDRRRIGALGARIGIGATLDLTPGIAVGLQYGLDAQRSWWRRGDPGTATSLFTGEASLLLQLQWPRQPR